MLVAVAQYGPVLVSMNGRSERREQRQKAGHAIASIPCNTGSPSPESRAATRFRGSTQS